MPKIKKGQDPVKVLDSLQRFMKRNNHLMETASDVSEKIKLLDASLEEHFITMGSLTTIYQSGNPKVDKVKTEIRSLYEQAKELKETLNSQLKDAPVSTKIPVTKKEPGKPKEKGFDEEAIIKAMTPIDNALKELKSKIGGIDQHQFKAAHKVANTLLTGLNYARGYYEADLRSGMDIKQAGEKFNESCKRAIATAKPTLEKDLGWGDYLKNLLKTIANAVVKVISLGTSSGFFTPIKSTSGKAVEKAENDLEIDEGKSSKHSK